MRISVKGLPIRLEMNRWMAVGCGLLLVAVAGWFAGWQGVLPAGLPYATVSLGVAILGAALYFIGRVVDLVGHMRKRP